MYQRHQPKSNRSTSYLWGVLFVLLAVSYPLQKNYGVFTKLLSGEFATITDSVTDPQIVSQRSDVQQAAMKAGINLAEAPHTSEAPASGAAAATDGSAGVKHQKRVVVEVNADSPLEKITHGVSSNFDINEYKDANYDGSFTEVLRGLAKMVHSVQEPVLKTSPQVPYRYENNFDEGMTFVVGAESKNSTVNGKCTISVDGVVQLEQSFEPNDKGGSEVN